MADDDLDEGPVVVKRAVYDAGMKLEAEVDGGRWRTSLLERRRQGDFMPGGGRYGRGGVLGRNIPVPDDPRVRGRRNGNHHP